MLKYYIRCAFSLEITTAVITFLGCKHSSPMLLLPWYTVTRQLDGNF